MAASKTPTYAGSAFGLTRRSSCLDSDATVDEAVDSVRVCENRRRWQEIAGGRRGALTGRQGTAEAAFSPPPSPSEATTTRREDPNYDILEDQLRDLLTLAAPANLRLRVTEVRVHPLTGGWELLAELSWSGSEPEDTSATARAVGVTLRITGYGPPRE